MENDTEDNKLSKKEKRIVLILSCAFTTVFTAFSAIQNLQSSLNREGGLGIISLSCVYATSILSSVFAPFVIRLLTPKMTIVVSFLIHTLYSGSNFYPTFWTMIPSSILLGLCTGPLWTSQGMYFSACSFSTSQRKNKSVEITLNKFHGFFIFSMSLPNIIGNLMSSLILSKDTFDAFDNSTNENSSVTARLCGANVCPGGHDNTSDHSPEQLTIYILMGSFAVCDLIGLLLVLFVLPVFPVNTTKRVVPLASQVTSCFKFTNVNFILMIPLILSYSFGVSFQWVDISQAYVNCPFGIRMIGLVLASGAFFFGVAGELPSRLTKLVGRQPILVLMLLIRTGVFLILSFWTPKRDDLAKIIVIQCIQGILDGTFRTQMPALISFLYPETTDFAFANYTGWKATGNATFLIASNFLCVRTKLVTLIVITFGALISYVVLEIRIFQKKNSAEEIEIEIREELKSTS